MPSMKNIETAVSEYDFLAILLGKFNMLQHRLKGRLIMLAIFAQVLPQLAAELFRRNGSSAELADRNTGGNISQLHRIRRGHTGT